jgi:hypothetical protein
MGAEAGPCLGVSALILKDWGAAPPSPWPMWRGRRAHPGSDPSTNGEEPAPRYSQGQLAQLELEGRALRLRDGTFGWGCADRRDLLNCIAAFNRGEAGLRVGGREGVS